MRIQFRNIGIRGLSAIAWVSSCLLMVNILQATDCGFSQGPNNGSCQGTDTDCGTCSNLSGNCGAYISYAQNPTRVCANGSQMADVAVITQCTLNAPCIETAVAFKGCSVLYILNYCSVLTNPIVYCYDCSRGTVTALPGNDCEAVPCTEG